MYFLTAKVVCKANDSWTLSFSIHIKISSWRDIHYDRKRLLLEGGAEIAVCIVQEYIIAVFICRSYKNQKIIFSKI